MWQHLDIDKDMNCIIYTIYIASYILYYTVLVCEFLFVCYCYVHRIAFNDDSFCNNIRSDNVSYPNATCGDVMDR
jgi:hypothetical protein